MLRTGVTKCLRRVLDKISVWFEGVQVAARIIERLFGLCIRSRDASDEDVQIFVISYRYVNELLDLKLVIDES